MLCHIDLQSYYQMIFAMVQHHKYSIKELEDLMPFERDIYVGLLMNYLKTLEQKRQQQNVG